jgi:hypothetical protein
MSNIKKYNYDGQQIGQQFIEFFYKNWIINPDILQEVILSYSKLKYNNKSYEGNDFILILKLLANNIQFNNFKYEIIDSKSRQIYILVTGNINNTIFTQSFVISFTGNTNLRKWVIISSILII